jgi:hypothetical protein
MTEKKLTARLSDGTEWKVVNNLPATEGSENRVVWLTPIKPSPPKELWVAVENATGLCGGTRLTEIGKGLNPDYTNFRYVLAEEPKENPQPREWWEVRYRDGDKMFTKTNLRIDLPAVMEHQDYEGQFYIVHVREVLA